MFTELKVCAICSGAIMQFRERYPGIQLNIFTGEMSMKKWGYEDYLSSVNLDVSEGLEVLGYDIFQALYFAYSSLELKLQHNHEEVVFALTAVLVNIMDRGVLSSYNDTDEFIVRFMNCYVGGEVGAGAAVLQGDDRDRFNGDVERVVAALKNVGFC